MTWDSEDIFLAQLSSPYCKFIIPPKDLSWHHLLAKARKEKTACIVYQSIKRERYVLPPSVTKQFEEIVDTTQSKNILITNQLLEIQKEFADKNVDATPLKGVFLAKFIHKELHHRPMADIDILVDKCDLRQANTRLEHIGYYPHLETPDIQGDYLNSINFIRNSELHPAPLHLHWNIINASLPMFMYKVDVKSIWNDARKIDYGGVMAYAMAPHHLLLHLAEHTLKHSFDSLINLVDIAQLIKFFSSPDTNEYKKAFRELNWDSVLKYARAWNFETPLYFSLRLANKLLAVPLPKDISTKYFNCLRSFEARCLLKHLMQNNRWQGLSVLGYLATLDITGKVRFLWSSLFPPPQDMESFGKVAEPENYIKRVKKAAKILFERLT